MRFIDYFKQCKNTLFLIIFAIITSEIFLLICDIPLFIRIYVVVSVLLLYFIGIILEYSTKKAFYNKLFSRLDELDNKYLIAEIIDKPEFIEGKILWEILKDTDKSMIENVNLYKYIQEDYKDYIELWIHEIKIPIATSKMIVENNKSEVTKSIDEELDKIENFTEQALFYARSNTVEKDYSIKENSLFNIVDIVIKKNKSILIANKVKIDIHDVENVVYTDTKWIYFILNQIIQNSVKYSKDDDKLIEIYSKSNKENIVLYIKDNGIGIKSSEISKVFDKGFTGTNGRVNGKKSTGIGLYLCKKLCDKLGIGIDIESEFLKYTIVKIIFPKGSYVNL